MTEHDETRSDGLVSRRSAIKKAAIGAAAAGVAWTAPRVEGLSLRPNYASAASVGNGFGTTMFTGDQPGDTSSLPIVTNNGKSIGDANANGRIGQFGFKTTPISASGTYVEKFADNCKLVSGTAFYRDSVGPTTPFPVTVNSTNGDWTVNPPFLTDLGQITRVDLNFVCN